MSISNSEVDVAIVGAGAAGLAAAKTLQDQGVSFALLEASHRIGGRAYTEEVLPGVPFDLGCHWLHSASLNPFVAIADELGIAYSKEGFPRNVFEDGRWLPDEEMAGWSRFYEAQHERSEAAVADGQDISLWEATERDSRWTPYYDYIASLNASHDPDQVSVIDGLAYTDTEENWPIKDGYGTLITRYGADVPVELNCSVSEIDCSGPGVRLITPKGDVRARSAVITVSTGILGAGDIRFTPELPDWKTEAIAALPLGGHNRICLAFDRDVFGSDVPRGFSVKSGENEPFSIRVRPFGFNYVVGVTGGRFADWLERAGQAAAVDYAAGKLREVFGNDVTRHMVKQNVTAWGGDPWVKGAYSAAQPGQALQRARLAEPLNEALYFAGEATSANFFSTAHGAYLTGVDVAERLAARFNGAAG